MQVQQDRIATIAARTDNHCVIPLICTGSSSSTPFGDTILRVAAMMSVTSCRDIPFF
jgi:hypothetical protein